MKKRLILSAVFILLIIIIIVMARTLVFTAEKDPAIYPTAQSPNINPDSALQHLATAIRFKTISYQDAGRFDSTVFMAFHEYLAKAFPEISTRLQCDTVGGFSLLYTWPGSDPALPGICLMAHQDVVPISAQTLQQWQHPPFSGTVADGYLWGRGAMDDKHNLIGILEATEALLKEGFQPRRTIYLAFGHDEEVSGLNGAKMIVKHMKSLGIQLAATYDEGGSIVKEMLPGIDRPIALIGVAEKGYVSLSLTLKTEGGHSSMPASSGAIEQLGEALARLKTNPFPANMDVSGMLFDKVGPYMGLGERLIFANRWLTEGLITSQLSSSPPTNAMIRTTTAITMFESGIKENILPKQARAVVNFRILPGETVESVTAHVRQTIDDPAISIEKIGASTNPSAISDPNSTAFAAIERALRQSGFPPETLVATFLVLVATDSRYFAEISDNVYRFSPVLLLPEDLPRIHGLNERIAVNDYQMLVRYYYHFLEGTGEW